MESEEDIRFRQVEPIYIKTDASEEDLVGLYFE